MDALHQLEIAVILFIQSFGSWLAGPMDIISMLGREEFYLLAMPIIYWCIDGRLGVRVASMLVLSNVFNESLKLVFHSPRPYWISTQVKVYSAEHSFGIPSGHAQMSAGMWGVIYLALRNKWWKTAILVMLFLVGFSRIFLGMHFISDVLLGWIFAGALVTAYWYLEAPLTRWLKALTLPAMLGLALLSSLIIAAIMPLALASMGSWQVPSEWVQNALAATPDTPIDPLNLDSAFTISGTWFGMMAGLAWLFHRQGGFNASGTNLQRFLRFLVGLVGIVIFWYFLGKIFPREQDLLSFALRYVRYSIIGVWITALAPMLFKAIGLTGSPASVPAPALEA